MSDTLSGALQAAASHVIWGCLTVYWGFLADLDSRYLLAQRIFWSFVAMMIVVAATRRTREFLGALLNGRNFAMSMLTASLLAVNWGTYIYAINSGRVLDASLAYFIEPQMIVLIGMIAFRERPLKGETVTMIFAAVSMIYMIWSTGSLPVLAIFIAGSFAIYGAFKKGVKISAQSSLLVEMTIAAPVAAAFIAWIDMSGAPGGIDAIGGWRLILLPTSGALTAAPLMLYNRGLTKIPYYLSGLIMYLNPTIHFAIGILYYKEALDPEKLVAFAIIWVGITFTIADRIREARSHARP